ncbi:amidohydrolase family protein [Aquipuribacter sp. SD81]|uniref:amidohydrolase family protein n=1 Tax=Aquipuribacter sp. SD81 TaxID=3127703 RepID=UPI0030184844
MTDEETVPWTDAHLHVVDFLAQPGDPAALREALLDSGAERAVVFGLPVKKKWSVAEPQRPGYYLDGNDPCGYHSATDWEVRALASELEGDGLEVAPLTCGFDPTDQVAGDVLRRHWDSWDRWAGVGEVLLRHDSLTNLTIGETPRADHPAMASVLRLAGERGLPVSVHHDTGSNGRPGAHEYAGQLDLMLRDAPDTDVVWCHAGSSRGMRPHDQLDLAHELMSRHDRLVLEVSWVLLDQVTQDGTVDERWVDVARRWPERVVVGTDAVADPDTVREQAARIQLYLGALPDDVRPLVASGNAGRLWFEE